jgi:hypothetical protein
MVMPKKEPTTVVRIPVVLSDIVLYIRSLYQKKDHTDYRKFVSLMREQKER